MLANLFEKFPWLEVFARQLYWRSARVRSAIARLRPGLQSQGAGSRPPLDFDRVIEWLHNAGVERGDIAIIHSSFWEVGRSGLKPEGVIAKLRSLVGENGTLAMPAIPIIPGEPDGADRMSDKPYDKLFTFNVRSSRISTGFLPLQLMRTRDAVRSRHPVNCMVAVGPNAIPMMTDNLASVEPMGCGPGSSWEYCYRHNAKIIMLGVDVAHSLTMIHVAEDSFADHWPVRNWYRTRRFKIEDGEFQQEVTIRERRHEWVRYFTERGLSADLRRAGITRSGEVDGLAVSVIEAKPLIEFLRAHPRPGYPYAVPRRLRYKHV